MTEYLVTNSHFPAMKSNWIVHWEMLNYEELIQHVEHKDTESLATLVENVIKHFAARAALCVYDSDIVDLNDELPIGIVLDNVSSWETSDISWNIKQV